MDMLSAVGTQLLNSLMSTWDQVVLWLPRVVGAAIVLLLGVYVSGALKSLTMKLFGLLKVEMLSERAHFGQRLRAVGLEVTLTQLVAGLVYWLIFLVFISAAASVLDLEVVTRFLDRMIGYIPAIFAGLVIMVIGVVVADTISKLLENVKLGRSYKTVVRWFILVLAFITAIEQIGIDVSFLAGNIQLLVAGASLGLGLAFGLGGKDRAKMFLDRHLP